jgi:hypothetical protein
MPCSVLDDFAILAAAQAIGLRSGQALHEMNVDAANYYLRTPPLLPYRAVRRLRPCDAAGRERMRDACINVLLSSASPVTCHRPLFIRLAETTRLMTALGFSA